MTSTSTETQDLQDMEQLRAGQDKALDHLMERYGDRLFRFLVRLLKDESDAEDVVQETFTKVYLHRTRFDPRHRFSTWVYTIAANLARDRLRRRLRQPESLMSSEPGDDRYNETLRDPQPNPGETLLAQETGALVRQAIHSLPDDLRMAILLSEYEEMSHAEIGQVMDCTAKAVEMRLYRARQALRSALTPVLAGLRAPQRNAP